MNARTQNDFAHLRASGAAVRHAFDTMRTACKPGMTTAELDVLNDSLYLQFIVNLALHYLLAVT